MSRWGLLCWIMTAMSFLILLATRYILGGWHWSLMIPLSIFFVGLFAAVMVDLKYYFLVLQKKSTRDGLSMGWFLCLVLGVVACINVLAVHFNFYVDVTEEKANSLSIETKDIVEHLKSEVTFKAFYNPRVEGQKRPLRELLKLYGATNSKIKWEFINTYLQPLVSKTYLKNSKDPEQFVLFAETNNKKIRVKYPHREESLTLALYQLQQIKKSKIYFLTGHGERSLDQSQAGSIKAFKDLLVEASYQVESLALIRTGSIPKDATLIAIVGPKTQLLDFEIEMLQNFAIRGGRFFLAVDPNESHNLSLLTKSLGVEFQNNIVVDDKIQLMGRGALTIMGEGFSLESPVTRDFGEQVFVLFDTASGLAPARRDFPNFSYDVLVSSSPRSYPVWDKEKVNASIVSTSPKNRKSVALGITVRGPLKKPFNSKTKDLLAGELPVAQNDSKNKSENYQGFLAVVFGDSDFLTQKDFYQGYNRDLALNAMAFLKEGGELLGIKMSLPKKSSLILTSVQRDAFLIAGVFLPVVLFLSSGLLWWRRRQL